MRKPVNIVVLLVLVFVVALTGCGPKNTGGGTEPVATDTPESLVPIPTPIPPTAIDRTIRLDPAIVNDNDSLTVSTYIYDCLTRLDINGEPQPGLALQWTPSDDQLDYVVTLRRGVKFTNGADFNADIVLANFNRWFDPTNALHGTATYTGWQNYFLGFLGEVDANNLPISFYDGIEKVDAYTVLIHLNRPEPNLFAILANPYFAMLDTQMLAAKGDAYGTSADTVSGTGAYEILSWNDSGLVLTPSPIFWGNLPTENLQFSWK
jgi:peptide/nickel transport system substrate-binding protein